MLMDGLCLLASTFFPRENLPGEPEYNANVVGRARNQSQNRLIDLKDVSAGSDGAVQICQQEENMEMTCLVQIWISLTG